MPTRVPLRGARCGCRKFSSTICSAIVRMPSRKWPYSRRIRAAAGRGSPVDAMARGAHRFRSRWSPIRRPERAAVGLVEQLVEERLELLRLRGLVEVDHQQGLVSTVLARVHV